MGSGADLYGIEKFSYSFALRIQLHDQDDLLKRQPLFFSQPHCLEVFLPTFG